MVLSTGCRMMASLLSCQDCSPAEVLHPSQGELSFSALQAKQKYLFSCWYFASWNVRSLLDVEGSVDTAKCTTESVTVDERRIDQVMKSYNIYLAGLQETKWFGAEVQKCEMVLCCHQ